MLEGIVRDSIGKKAAKALKRDGYLLANIYGKGAENVNAAFKRNEFIKAMRKREITAKINCNNIASRCAALCKRKHALPFRNIP